MHIQITITGEFDERSVFHQLESHGWAQTIKGRSIYISLFRSIYCNGKDRSVENYEFEVRTSENQMVFLTMDVPVGINLRTGFTVYRVLAGRLVGDLIRNDDLRILSYGIAFVR